MYNRERTEEAEKILQRIISEMNRKGIKQSDFERRFDLPRSTFSGWKIGKSRNFCEHLGEISEYLGVNVEYLVTGGVSDKVIENEREQELLDWYRKLDSEKQNSILQHIKWLAPHQL